MINDLWAYGRYDEYNMNGKWLIGRFEYKFKKKKPLLNLIKVKKTYKRFQGKSFGKISS